MEQIFDFFWHLMAVFVVYLPLENVAKIEKTANFSPKNGHKMPKNQKIENLFRMKLDFSSKIWWPMKNFSLDIKIKI